MKKMIIRLIVIVFGLLISLGPQFLFKVCGSTMMSSGTIDDCCIEPEVSSCCAPVISSRSVCYWTARAEIGIGLLIVALGACLIFFTDLKTQLGLLIGIFLASIIALFIPYTLIGGCASMDMQCHRIAFPALTAESIVLLIFSAVVLTVNTVRNPPAKSSIKN